MMKIFSVLNTVVRVRCVQWKCGKERGRVLLGSFIGSAFQDGAVQLPGQDPLTFVIEGLDLGKEFIHVVAGSKRDLVLGPLDDSRHDFVTDVG